MVDVVTELETKARRLPVDGAPVVQTARKRALAAVETVAAAVAVDPTLPEADRCGRDVALLDEILRQLAALARQAETELRRRRLVAEAATATQVARLGRTNPLAPDEVAALSARAVEVAERISSEAWPDWNTPERIHERSVNLLPDDHELEQIADRLRRAVKPALNMPHPAAEAVRLAALADQITLTTQRRRRVCAGPGCQHELKPAPTGRPRLYCSPACRQRARRLAQPAPAAEEGVVGKRERTRPANLDALLAGLPADTRPAPSVEAYDDLLGRPTPITD